MATPVTSAQVVKAWMRPNRRFAAVSWSRRRGKTLATWRLRGPGWFSGCGRGQFVTFTPEELKALDVES
jgi:hypothetical protein